MRILYFTWGENSKESCVEGLRFLGHEVKVVRIPYSAYDFDMAFIGSLEKEIRSYRAEAVFSFNYFPDIARTVMKIREEVGDSLENTYKACSDEVSSDPFGSKESGEKHLSELVYISWVYDSPHLTLESVTLGYPCNRVFVFDYALAQRYINQGFDTVGYMPLPAKNYDFGQIAYQHDVTFMGSLYDGKQDQFGQITYLPEELRGYLDACIKVQENLYGFDIIDQMLTEEKLEEVSGYVKAELGENYRKSGGEIFKNMVRRRVTMEDRIGSLRELGKVCKLDLYSGSKPDSLPVRYLGYADYNTQMPEIFYSSKINLNISLRSIQTGIPLRVMDILGAGGFCMTNYQSELPEYFENGVDLVWYESKEDLVEKVQYYLAHDEEREEIARNGHRKAQELFSYERLLGEIFAAI